MDIKDIEFLKKLIVTYRIEAQEHLNLISSRLVELETCSDEGKRKEIGEQVFREAHSLKGASRAVNLIHIEKLCQAMESVFSALKRDKITPSKEMFSLLAEALDTIQAMVATADPAIVVPDSALPKKLISDLEQMAKGTAPAGAGPKPSAPKPEDIPGKEPEKTVEQKSPSPTSSPASHDIPVKTRPTKEEPPAETTVRISVEKLDKILHQVEEFVLIKLAIADQFNEMQKMHAHITSWDAEWAKIAPDMQKLRQGSDISERIKPLIERHLEFLNWNYHFIKTIEGNCSSSIRVLGRERQSLDSLVEGLLEDMREVLMLPSSSLLEMYPRLVRELGHTLGREVRLEIDGGSIEIDRRILDDMRDPLTHLIRNAVDHGIEPPEAREKKGKPRQGTIKIEIRLKSGSRVEIAVSDDGNGIDVAGIKGAAAKSGAISTSELERLTDKEALGFIFRSGITTSSIITDVSGHGLGLAIVQEKVEKLGGSVALESTPGSGTTFRLLLPLTLVKFKGILVDVDDQSFVFPMAYVERTIQVQKESIKPVENRETMMYDGGFIPVVHLGRILELAEKPGRSDEIKKIPVVVAKAGGTRIGFMVDAINNEQDVLVKSLGRQLSRVRNISGTTVIGNGKLVPIVHVPDLVKSSMRSDSLVRGRRESAPATQERKKILVAEDSITSRTLLKNILESAGYRVKTAVDGFEAWNMLNIEAFDIVVSDVDMPRMNGFNLTEKIKNDAKHGNLPVILVTSLDSREDRERGIEVGANAYIVKSSFDQTNLLEIIDRLGGS